MASAAERLFGKTPTTAGWTPPKLDANGHFTSQADIDAFKTALFGPLGTAREQAISPQNATVGGSTGLNEHGGATAGVNYDPVAVRNNKLAREWGHANGFWTDPAQHGGLKQAGDTLVGFGKDVVLSPPVLAALTAGIGSAISAGAGEAVGAGAGEAAGVGAGELSADQLLAQSAAGLSVAGPAETAAALGAGTEVAAGAAGAGAGAQFGGTTQSAAGDAGATGGGSKGAAAYLATAKDVAGLALTGLGLAAATGAVGSTSAAPPAPTTPPQDQQGSNMQDVQNADANDQRFPNLGGSGDDTLFNGASGIDPFMLNLGRAKLLGQ